jgi:hypothetical protein
MLSQRVSLSDGFELLPPVPQVTALPAAVSARRARPGSAFSIEMISSHMSVSRNRALLGSAEIGCKRDCMAAPHAIPPLRGESDIIIIITFTRERPEGFRHACPIPRVGDGRKPAWPFSRI